MLRAAQAWDEPVGGAGGGGRELFPLRLRVEQV